MTRPYAEVRDLCVCEDCTSTEADDNVRTGHANEPHMVVNTAKDIVRSADIHQALNDIQALAQVAEDEVLAAAVFIVQSTMDRYFEAEDGLAAVEGPS